MTRDFSVGNLITSYRTRLGLKQDEVANPDDPELLTVSLRTYQGWENGERIPSNKWLRRIAAFFHLTDAEADELYRAAAQVAPEIDNFPFPQNPFFTGRETLLKQLDELFQKNDSVAITQPVSISGLGGIGKTQLALEYAHRHYPKVYRTVFLVNAADKASLEASYLALAYLLKLPEKNERETDRIVRAVKMWLAEHIGWLLILDNADDLQLARSFLPTTPRGQILLTTRSQIVGNIAVPITIEAMELEEGLLFLLRRSGALKHHIGPEAIPSNIRDKAAQLVELLGGHPLALDQAGAYIEETGTSFANYMQLYSDQRIILLNKRGSLGDEHPEAVAVTLQISFQQACERYSFAANVLCLCSFLHPDAIPEELLSQDKDLKMSTIAFDMAIAALTHYSLIKRDAEEKVLTVHRLVQAVMQDTMDMETRKLWIQRAAQATYACFSWISGNLSNQRYLQHTQVCSTWIEQEQIISQDAGDLLFRAGNFLNMFGWLAEAEPLYRQALSICKQLFEPEHTYTGKVLIQLATVYHRQAKYELAEPLYRQAISIRKKEGGINLYEELPILLHNLASIYQRQGNYGRAELLYQEALSILEEEFKQIPSDWHFEFKREKVVLIAANLWKGLADLYQDQSLFAETEALYIKVLEGRNNLLGPCHLETVHSLIDLADFYQKQGKYDQAEPLYQEALSTQELMWPLHPISLRILCRLTSFYENQGRFAEAEALYISGLAEWNQLSDTPYAYAPIISELRGNYISLLQKMERDAETSLLEGDQEIL